METLNKKSQQIFFFFSAKEMEPRNSKWIHLPCSIKTLLFVYCGHWFFAGNNRGWEVSFWKCGCFCLSKRSKRQKRVKLPSSDKKKLKMYLVLKGYLYQSESNTFALWRWLFQCKYTIFSWAVKLADDWFKLYKHQSQTVLFILSPLEKKFQERIHTTLILIL